MPVDTSTTDRSALLEEIRALETELAARWRELRETPHAAAEGVLQVLEVETAGIRCLVPVASVREVSAMVRPEPLTDAPGWVQGTIQYGRQAVPVIDLGLRLRGAPTPLSARHFIVISDEPRWLGLVVSAVGRVVGIEAAHVSSPGPEIPFAPFLLGVVVDDGAGACHLLSVRSLGRELDG